MTVLQGIRPYDRAWLSRDMVAGVTLAALAVPEVMGYTKIAGTPVITGLYTLLAPMIVFAVLGSSRHLVVAGDSATAAIMFAGISALGISGVVPGSSRWLALASVTALLSGGLLLIARVARLGFLADFISRTVLVGFLTGVGVQVAAGQVGGMLGVPEPKVAADRFAGTLIKLWDTLGELGQTSAATLAVSVGVLVILIAFERWIKAIPGGLVAVIGAIVASWALDLKAHGVATLGPVPSGLPHVGLPGGVSWSDIVAIAGTSVSIVLVILAQSAATSRAYAVKYQERFVENHDLVGLGVANLAAGLTSTFVVNGSPTKTEMVDSAGGTSQLAQLVTAGIVLAVLLFVTAPLSYLPGAVIAAIVFIIGVHLIDYRGMQGLLHHRPVEFAVALVTALTVVFVSVGWGIALCHRPLHDRTSQAQLQAAEFPPRRNPGPGMDADPSCIREAGSAWACDLPVRGKPVLCQ